MLRRPMRASGPTGVPARRAATACLPSKCAPVRVCGHFSDAVPADRNIVRLIHALKSGQTHIACVCAYVCVCVCVCVFVFVCVRVCVCVCVCV